MNLSLLILGSLLSAIVVLGNGFVTLLVSKRPSLRSTSGGIFILSLAVADFCLGLTYFPLNFVNSRHQGLNNFVLILQLLFSYASLANLCALVADRYISVVFPLKHTYLFTQKNIYATVTACWMTAILYALLGLIPFLTKVSHVLAFVLGVIYTVIFSILPTLILVVTTVHLMLVVRRLRKQTVMIVAQLSFNKMSCNTTVNRRYREFDYVKVLAVLVAFFSIFSLMDIVSNICYFSEITRCVMDDAVTILHLINSAINPFVYALLKKDIWKEIKCFLGHGPVANTFEV